MVRRLLLVSIAAIALLAIAALALGWLLARPVQRRIGEPPPDLGAIPVAFASASGTTVHAWWCPRREASGTVVLLPGVRANRLSMVGRARFLRNAGFSVLLPDLQATGETVGSEITFGWRERLDVIAAVDFARSQHPHARIAILGSSLGGAAALLAVPPLEVDALIVEAVYPTIERATANRLEMRLGRAGRLAAPVLLAQLRPRIGVPPSSLRPVDHVARVSWPILIIGGANDRHTTAADTRWLYRSARAPKALWLVPGAAHVDLHRFAKDEYERRVIAFLNSPSPTRGAPHSPRGSTPAR